MVPHPDESSNFCADFGWQCKRLKFTYCEGVGYFVMTARAFSADIPCSCINCFPNISWTVRALNEIEDNKSLFFDRWLYMSLQPEGFTMFFLWNSKLSWKFTSQHLCVCVLWVVDNLLTQCHEIFEILQKWNFVIISWQEVTVFYRKKGWINTSNIFFWFHINYEAITEGYKKSPTQIYLTKGT